MHQINTGYYRRKGKLSISHCLMFTHSWALHSKLASTAHMHINSQANDRHYTNNHPVLNSKLTTLLTHEPPSKQTRDTAQTNIRYCTRIHQSRITHGSTVNVYMTCNQWMILLFDPLLGQAYKHTTNTR